VRGEKKKKAFSSSTKRKPTRAGRKSKNVPLARKNRLGKKRGSGTAIEKETGT